MNRMIELSPRLSMIAELVPDGAKLVDVGTDHAYLPSALILSGRISGAIAADLREGPLSRARKTAELYGLTERVQFRLCDGLQGISPEEINTAVIAGMGGETIASILAAAPWTLDQGTRLILQPMSSMNDLRRWLWEHGYKIVQEELAREGDTIYTGWLVQAGKMKELSQAELWAGRNTPDPLRGPWLEYWISRTERALTGLSRSEQEQAVVRRNNLKEVLSGLVCMKKEWEQWQ